MRWSFRFAYFRLKFGKMFLSVQEIASFFRIFKGKIGQKTKSKNMRHLEKKGRNVELFKANKSQRSAIVSAIV